MNKKYDCRGLSVAVGHRLSVVAAAVTLAASCGWANAQDAGAGKLGNQLTYVGADAAASADGVIPAWQPPGPQGGNWQYGELRADHWVHKGDQPVATITSANVSEFAEYLSPGQIEMLNQIPGYQMDVYPTRRSCGIPDFVAENSQKNVGFARLDATGLALDEAYVPGVPFPMPENGVQAMWNMKMRYRGIAFDMSHNLAGVSPRKGSDEWLKLYTEQFTYLPWAKQGSHLFSDYGHIDSAGYFSYNAPAALAGQAAVLMGKAGEQMETFYYFPGQRRVRRMPSYAYDAPQVGLDNQYNVDEISMFAGPLDRFDWKLVGKQEMIVPYNSFGLYDFKANFEDVAKRDFIAPSHRRYERHRVWVVEATVRDGMRHSAPKRVFFIDEDSWSPLLALDYDAQGRVAKVREGYLIPVYETGACDVQTFAQHNLIDGRYLFDNSSMGTGADNQWVTEQGGDPKLRMSFYSADSLRAISDR